MIDYKWLQNDERENEGEVNDRKEMSVNRLYLFGKYNKIEKESILAIITN